MPIKPHRSKPFIDFSKLSSKELTQLTRKWYIAAMSFEQKLESSMRFDKTLTDEQLAVLWNRGNQLWKRVRILERWMNHNNKQKA